MVARETHCIRCQPRSLNHRHPAWPWEPKALHRLNPPNSPDGFDLAVEYPRWRLARDRRKESLAEVEPIMVWFCLEPQDIAKVAARRSGVSKRRVETVQVGPPPPDGHPEGEPEDGQETESE